MGKHLSNADNSAWHRAGVPKALSIGIIVTATHYSDPLTCWGSSREEKTVLVTKGDGTAPLLALHSDRWFLGSPGGGPLPNLVGIRERP